MFNYLYPTRRREKDLFDALFEPTMYHGNFSTMRTDIKETENEYLLDVELAGYKKEDVKISLKDGYLKIEASKSKENNENENHYITKEIFYGSTSRSYYVGNVDKAKISAKFENGILEVSVPKEELVEDETKNYISIV